MSEPVELASQSYNRGDYTSCIRNLNFLPSSDCRVEHNKALAELMANETRGSDRYRVTLARLVGAAFPRGDVSPASLRRPTLVYNYAVVLYHARHYRQAEDVLQRLIDEKIDSELKRRVVLLSVEVCVCRRAARRALDLVRTHSRLFGQDAPQELAMLSRLACRARLLLGERVEAGGAAESGVEGLVLSAHVRYSAGDARGAADTLARHSALTHTYTLHTQGEDVWSALNNDLGVVNMALGKPALAAKYFQTAIKEQLRCTETETSEGGARLTSVRDRPLYVYNLGLALLRAARPAPAFDCLVEAARHFPSNPQLWKRLADCCVRHAVPDPTAPPVLLRYGSGACMRIAITSQYKQEYSTMGESFAIPNLSLEFAALCLRNALTLLSSRDEEPTPAPPGAPLAPQARRTLRQAVLVSHSYVLLKLQDPLAALHSANEVTRESEASGGGGAAAAAMTLLAHSYAAESLIRLDRLGDASDHLQSGLLSDLAPDIQDLLRVQVWATAALCHMLRGDVVTARKILSQLDSPRIYKLLVYLETSSTNQEACVAILRRMKSSP